MTAAARVAALAVVGPASGPSGPSVPDERRGAVGARVRAVRRLARLTQDQLAARTHYSLGLVHQVEQGRAPASPAFLAAAATALGVEVRDLDPDAAPSWWAGEPPRTDGAAALEVIAEVLALTPAVAEQLDVVHGRDQRGGCRGCGDGRAWPCATAWAAGRGRWLASVRR